MDVVKGTFSYLGTIPNYYWVCTVNKVFSELEKINSKRSINHFGSQSTICCNISSCYSDLMLSDIFVPIIPAIVAGGLLMGCIRF